MPFDDGMRIKKKSAKNTNIDPSISNYTFMQVILFHGMIQTSMSMKKHKELE